jgi:HemX protein
MQAYLPIAAIFCLLASFGYTLFRLGSGRLRPGKTNLAAMSAAFILLSIDLWLRGRIIHACPINSLFDILVFMGWATILIYLVVGSAYRLSLLGAFTAPLVLSMLLVAQLAPLDRGTTGAAVRNPWIEFHAALSIIAYGAFALAGVAGLMYLVQDRQLKKRKAGHLLYNLPPITRLAVANTRLLWLGLGLLTVAFAAGFVSGMRIDTLKFGASAIIWAAYAATTLLDAVHKLSPRRTAASSVAILAAALASLPVIQHLSTPQ